MPTGYNLRRVYLFITLLFFIAPIQGQQFRLLRPVADSIQTNGSYLYAEPNISNRSLGHRGIDILVRYDTVYSASDGMVDFIGYNPNDPVGGYEPNGGGNYIFIKSRWEGSTIFLLYAHLTHPLVTADDSVYAGQPIAISGNTGYSTGPHLHFEIRMHTRDFNSFRSRRNPEMWVGIQGMGAIYGNIPNAPNSTRVDITPNPKPRPPYTTFSWALTYNFSDFLIGNDDVYNENYAIGDVKPGTYTITALNGAYRRVVTVGEGEIVSADPPASVGEFLSAGRSYLLHQNYPNPFNPVTNISFELASDSDVVLSVYDLLGRKIETLVDGRKPAGAHTVYFDAHFLPAGVYIYSFMARSDGNVTVHSENKKMILIK
jgi:murein DD-endopeptidase MepM/ murein hydrolase activator NlpD